MLIDVGWLDGMADEGDAGVPWSYLGWRGVKASMEYKAGDWFPLTSAAQRSKLDRKKVSDKGIVRQRSLREAVR
jgi:hypothetical protein